MKKERFDKYKLYKEAVQDPKKDIEFFAKIYRSIYKKQARLFREDFCGTFLLGLEWILAHPKNKAFVVDKSLHPLKYGQTHHLNPLDKKTRQRLKVFNTLVSDPKLPKAEIISVNNFSYFILKKRELLLNYFKKAHSKLHKKGLFILDIFGGPGCEEPNEEVIRHKGFTYYWDQHSFNPITNEAQFFIHFKRDKEKKRMKVFQYNWRMWSLPEVTDLLKQAGFSQVHVYWEQSNAKGDGLGIFKKAKKGDICDTWIAYIVSQP